MKHLTKQWSWLLAIGFVAALALSACESTSDHASTSQPSQQTNQTNQAKSEHPTSEHPK